jgi:hypothetical protein
MHSIIDETGRKNKQLRLCRSTVTLRVSLVEQELLINF